MPRIFEAIGRGIVGAGRAIRGGAAQATPLPSRAAAEEPMDEVPRPNVKRNAFQQLGARIKRDATNAPFARGVRALRSRAAKRGGKR